MFSRNPPRPSALPRPIGLSDRGGEATPSRSPVVRVGRARARALSDAAVEVLIHALPLPSPAVAPSSLVALPPWSRVSPLIVLSFSLSFSRVYTSRVHLVLFPPAYYMSSSPDVHTYTRARGRGVARVNGVTRSESTRLLFVFTHRCIAMGIFNPKSARSILFIISGICLALSLSFSFLPFFFSLLSHNLRNLSIIILRFSYVNIQDKCIDSLR